MMRTITLKLDEGDYDLIKGYAEANNQTLSSLIRDSVIERIEDDLNLDEERILAARKAMETEKSYNHEKTWEMLGI